MLLTRTGGVSVKKNTNIHKPNHDLNLFTNEMGKLFVLRSAQITFSDHAFVILLISLLTILKVTNFYAINILDRVIL